MIKLVNDTFKFLSTAYPILYPEAVRNQSFEAWYNKTLQACIADQEDRECHMKNGDINTGQIVSQQSDNEIQSTLHIVSILYSEPLHIVNIFGEKLQWKLSGLSIE